MALPQTRRPIRRAGDDRAARRCAPPCCVRPPIWHLRAGRMPRLSTRLPSVQLSAAPRSTNGGPRRRQSCSKVLDSARNSITQPPNGSSTEALEHQLRALNAILTDAATGPLLRNVVAASASEPEVTEAVFDQWLQPRRAAVDAILRRAAAQGEIPDCADIEVIVDALVSPPCYRLLFALPPLDDAALTQLLETVWRGCQRPAGL
jgi:tetracycline repressor-like protein